MGLEKPPEELAGRPERLIELELELANLTRELKACTSSYHTIVAPKYAQLDSALAEVAEIIATIHPECAQAQERARRLRAQAWQTTKEWETQTVSSTNLLFCPAAMETYKRVLRAIHPAFTFDESERKRRSATLLKARRMLVTGDEMALTRLLEQEHLGQASKDTDNMSPVSQTPALMPGCLEEFSGGLNPRRTDLKDPALKGGVSFGQDDQVAKEISSVETQIEALTKTDQYELWLKIKEATNEGVDLLEQIAQEVDNKLGNISRQLETLLELSDVP